MLKFDLFNQQLESSQNVDGKIQKSTSGNQSIDYEKVLRPICDLDVSVEVYIQ